MNATQGFSRESNCPPKTGPYFIGEAEPPHGQCEMVQSPLVHALDRLEKSQAVVFEALNDLEKRLRLVLREQEPMPPEQSPANKVPGPLNGLAVQRITDLEQRTYRMSAYLRDLMDRLDA